MVSCGGRLFSITDATLSFDRIEARDLETGNIERLAIDSLEKPDTGPPPQAPDLTLLDSDDVDEARRRLSVIQPLVERERRTAAEISEACRKLNVGKTTVYRWMNAYATDGRLSSLLPTKRSGGRGKSRLSTDVEALLQSIITDFHLKPPDRSIRTTVREVRRRFRNAGLNPPHENTVRARIAAIPEETSLRKRGHSKKADDRYTPRPGTYDEATHPLSIVQVDHTPLDIVCVDEQMRLPLRRPWLTLAIDVYSRMILGFYISFDNPGALGTGLCLARAILPKETWLARLDVKQEWPCWGFPTRIHVDNAKEFRGEMLRLACEQYGVEINFRPVASPSTGGHIERLIGKVNTERMHGIAGAAMKPSKRGDYDPSKHAVMTISELEQNLTEWITGIYHRDYHTEIMMPPLKRWTDAIMGDGTRAGCGLFPRPSDSERLYIDFMPVRKRTIQHYGVQIDDIFYFGDVLRRYVNISRKGSKKHIFHFDPRDVSVIYFWDPDSKRHYAIPYRNGVHPPISTWELKAVRDHLRKQGREAVDEQVIFDTYERLRQQEERAAAETREIRRNHERKAALARDKKQRTPTENARVIRIATHFDRIEPLEMEEEL